jgi:protein-disulfide isomerase
MSTLILAVNSADHYQGNINADITLVKYGDYQCPSCRLAHTLVKQLLKEKGNALKFVFRNFPLRKFHPYAFISGVAAEAAGKQGQFWEMHDLIFENQVWLNSNFLMSLAEQLGLDMARFANDLKSEVLKGKVEMDLESGIRSGVNRVPTFFLNSKLMRYDGTYKSLTQAIRLQTEMKT